MSNNMILSDVETQTKNVNCDSIFKTSFGGKYAKMDCYQPTWKKAELIKVDNKKKSAVTNLIREFLSDKAKFIFCKLINWITKQVRSWTNDWSASSGIKYKIEEPSLSEFYLST